MQKWLLWCGLAVCAIASAGCRQEPDETRVRDAVAAAAQAAEQADAGDLIERLSPDFDGNSGSLDRNDLANLVRLARLRGQHIGVTLGPVAVEHHGERLVASFAVTLTQGSHLLPDAAGVYRVESAWRKERGDWRCYSATWERQL